MILSLLTLSLALSNLLLIAARVFFISYILFHLQTFKSSLLCVYHKSLHAFLSFLTVWSLFSVSVLTSLCTNFTICVIYVSVDWFFWLYTIFSVFSSLDIFGSDAIHCSFYIACWVWFFVFCFFFAVPSMFWNIVNSLRNILILSGVAFQHC